MRSLFALVIGFGVVLTGLAAEPKVSVFCPAISADNNRDPGNGPEDCHEVVLMVVGKTTRPPAKRGERRASSSEAHVQIAVERAMFGSLPGKVLTVNAEDASLPEDADKVSYIYAIAAKRERASNRPTFGQPMLTLDGYFSGERTYPLTLEKEATALAQARLDELVLSCDAIVIGRQTAATKDGVATVKIERTLHGPLKAGQQIQTGREEQPVPRSGTGPFIYFLHDPRDEEEKNVVYELTTRWSPDAVDTVAASLKRRDRYPIKEVTDDDDAQTVRRQEILFLGSRAEALDMLQWHGHFSRGGDPFEILGARRVLSEGEPAIPDVVALVEKHLWSDKIVGQPNFQWQMNLIRILGMLENNRPDGEVARLVGEVLTKAEKGATFPSPPPTAKELEDRRFRSRYDRSPDIDANHSLAWLLLTLDPADATRLFGERLLKFRDLTAYGWKEEANYVLDLSHIEDHLALGKVEPHSKDQKPVSWVAGFDAHDLTYYRLAFSPDSKYLAAVGHHGGRVWNTRDWSLVGKFESSASEDATAFASDGNSLFLIGEGSDAPVLERIDWRSGKPAQHYAVGADGYRGSMQVSGDGKWLLTAFSPDGPTVLYDVASGDVLERHAEEEWGVLKLRSDGKSFLGQKDGWSWHMCETRGKQRIKLPFPARDLAWADDGIWSLEAAPVEKPTSPAKVKTNTVDDDDVPTFSRPRRNAILRKRKLADKYSITTDQPLSFAAIKLLSSDDGKTLVAISHEQVEVFAAPEWKSVASWSFPKPASSLDRDSYERNTYELSSDGRQLAVAKAYVHPRVFDVRSGKQIKLGGGHSNEIAAVEFVDDRTVRTRDKDGVVLRWDATSGKQLEAAKDDADWSPDIEDSVRPRGESLMVDDEGKTWWFKGKNGGAYQRYTSFEIHVLQKGAKQNDDDFDSELSPGEKVLGEIEVRWGQRRPMGLVPGGEYLHLGTQVFARKDLKPVSAVNVQGEIEQMTFSRDGKRYALLTAEYESRPTVLGPGVRRREQVAQRLRVHDTRSGETLFALPTPTPVRLLTLSPDGSQIATVNDRQQVEVWALP
jgi:WD40 repeat protein